MLTPEYLQGLPAELEKLYLRLEEETIADICRRIAKVGHISDTAEYQILRMRELGAGTEYIKSKIKEYSGLSADVVDRLFFDAAQVSDELYKGAYAKAGKEYKPSEYNDFFQHILINNMTVINKYFDKNSSIKRDFFKWFNFKNSFKYNIKNILLLPWKNFSYFKDTHMPSPILKSTMEELWNKEFEILDKTSKDKFRQMDGVNQYLFKDYDIARGNFEVISEKHFSYYDVADDRQDLINTILKQSKKIICMNDTKKEFNFEKTKEEVNDAFEKILPDKSKFEI